MLALFNPLRKKNRSDEPELDFLGDFLGGLVETGLKDGWCGPPVQSWTSKLVYCWLLPTQRSQFLLAALIYTLYPRC